MEIFKKIVGSEKYSVSNYGRVRNDNTGKMVPQGTNFGYRIVSLFENGKAKKYRVHRLVADAFIPNPNNYPIVNHKDEIKDNNRMENLEWCTHSYNTRYGNCIKKMRQNNPQCKKVIIDNIIFDSLALGGKYIGCSHSTLLHQLNLGNTQYRGHTISYIT